MSFLDASALMAGNVFTLLCTAPRLGWKDAALFLSPWWVAQTAIVFNVNAALAAGRL